MYSLNMPIGCPVRLIATARAGADVHRWDVRVVTANGGSAPQLSYGSRIGGLDRDQRIDIPAQGMACRLEVAASHWNGNGWDDDRSVVSSDTPSMLELGFDAPGAPATREPDILLSFEFKAAVRSAVRRDVDGQTPEEIQPRAAQAQANGAQTSPSPSVGAGLAQSAHR